jgi:hypothetical protein
MNILLHSVIYPRAGPDYQRSPGGALVETNNLICHDAKRIYYLSWNLIGRLGDNLIDPGLYENA